MITIPLRNRIDFLIDLCIFRRPSLQHGPTVFPWWTPVAITVCRWAGNTQGGINIWIYTRWNAAFLCGVHFTGRSAA